MNKLWLIIKREYLTRVKRKAFILVTIGTPLAIALFMLVVTLIFSSNSDDLRIVLRDDSGMVKAIKDTKNLKFKLDNATSLDELRSSYEASGYDGILYIPPIGDNFMKENFKVNYYSHKQLGITTKEFIDRELRNKFREYKIDRSNIDRKILDDLKTEVSIEEKAADKAKEALEEKEGTSTSAEVATILGMFMGFIMYLVVFIYGSMVMRSVMEEKTSRIVEIMISSVKPFQLMMGKLVGVGFVGLTQVLIWAILIPGLVFIVSLLFPMDPASMQDMGPGTEVDVEALEYQIAQVWESLRAQNWWMILPMFIFFFLGGYFLYASLFAAIGSAMGDDLGEGQSLTIPITIPVILALYIMIAVVQNPNSSMAVWSSFIPFFSPIVMPARLAFSPPLWEIILSIVILAASAVFFVWLAGRIYRIGILMYGKKVTLREIGKWLFYKD